MSSKNIVSYRGDFVKKDKKIIDGLRFLPSIIKFKKLHNLLDIVN